MDFIEWTFKEPMSINEYGIPEPVSNKIRYPDVLLVPLVAFDNNLNRIGYGGGYYDRYIKKSKGKKNYYYWTCFFISKSQKIKTNKFDIKLDFIVTEKKNIMRILFLGDVVEVSGCSKIINNLLNEIKKKNIDFVIVNAENAATSGVGLTKRNL